MNRHADPGPHPFVHALQFVAARMAGHMHQSVAVLDDPHALVDQAVLDFEDCLLVARNGARGKHHRVARRQRDRLHFVAGELGECRTLFTLAAGADDHQVLARDETVILLGDEFRQAVHVAELVRNADDAFQRAPKYQNLPSAITGGFRDRANAPDIGGEGGDGDAALGLLDHLAQAFAHLLLGRRISVAHGVGGIADKRQHALVAKRAETRLVGHRADFRRRIDLPVAGMDHGAGGRGDRQ